MGRVTELFRELRNPARRADDDRQAGSKERRLFELVREI
jgi:hypothetical protein